MGALLGCDGAFSITGLNLWREQARQTLLLPGEMWVHAACAAIAAE